LHQSPIVYLIAGNARALFFDTGMGIGDLKALTLKLNKHFRAGPNLSEQANDNRMTT
jgi:hypothetical protein